MLAGDHAMATPASDRSFEQRLRELAITNELIKTITSSLPLPDILRIVLDRIKTLTRAEALSLLLYDKQRDELMFAATETLREDVVVGMRVPPPTGIAGWVAHTGRSAVVNDVAKDPRFYDAVDRVMHFATHSVLAVPLTRGNRVIGVIEIANRYDGTSFSDDDLRDLERLSATVSQEIDIERLPHDREALRALLGRVAAAVPGEASSLLLYDPHGRQLLRASRTQQPGVIDGMRLRCDRGIAGWVARHREPVRLDDAAADPRYDPSIESQTHFVAHTMLCVPILSKDTLLGVIQMINKTDNTPFTEEELRVAETLANHSAIAIENASLYRQAYLASITDDLTGLSNARHFNRMLPELMQRGRPLSLVVLDLDNFKHIVDTYGHLVGSRTIGQLGGLIGQMARPGDIAARFGGDEFVIILPLTDCASALEIAEAVRFAIESCTVLEGHGVDISTVTASVGVATFPDHASNADDLFRAADAAMYAVKRQDKNGVAAAGSRPSG